MIFSHLDTNTCLPHTHYTYNFSTRKAKVKVTEKWNSLMYGEVLFTLVYHL